MKTRVVKTRVPKVKSHPVPIRFKEREALFLDDAAESTGLPTSEIVRRCVRLMQREQERQQSFGFMLELAR